MQHSKIILRKINRLTYAFILFISGVSISEASPVAKSTAQKVATNFYVHIFNTPVTFITLAYIEKDSAGVEVYYAFNINNKNGFVIVSAEDAGRPIIGYSNTGEYKVPETGTNFDFWMKQRKSEIMKIRPLKLTATLGISNEWKADINNTGFQTQHKAYKTSGSLFPSNTLHLVQSTWDQPAPYNDDCPGGSVTGCVATAMAQIMKYWSFPPNGLGSSSYNEGTYGILSANYSHPYRWANMPLNSPTAADTDLARLLSDIGISVQMNYSPSGSGASVITSDDPTACSQISYVKYFNYSSAILDGMHIFSDTVAWQDTLKHELDENRPFQYVGTDPVQGGHTWVCDGYNANNDFHMNWGWSGAADGWYTLNTLNPEVYNFSMNREALIGIEPSEIYAKFTGTPSTGCASTTVNFLDQSFSPTPITSWNWSFPGGTPSTSTLPDPIVTYNTTGVYNVTETVTSSTGTNSLTQTAYINIIAPASLPITQGFESGVFPPAEWAIYNPGGHMTTWAAYTGAGGYGKSTHCMYFNNCMGGVAGQYDQIYTLPVNYTGDTYPYIYFDVAYSPYDTITYSDTLAIYYSTNCGNTWNNVYLKGGTKLSTTGKNTVAGGGVYESDGCFVPMNTNWRTDTIVIPAIAGQSSVIFSFENRSGNGEGIYIDNIYLPKIPLGIPNIVAPSSITIYPNPNNGVFNMEIQGLSGKSSLEVYNMLGDRIYVADLNTASVQLNMSNKADGIYLYRIITETGVLLGEGKFIIQK